MKLIKYDKQEHKHEHAKTHSKIDFKNIFKVKNNNKKANEGELKEEKNEKTSLMIIMEILEKPILKI